MNQSHKQSDGPTFIALIFILLICFSLMGLTAMVLPQIVGFVIVVTGFLFLFSFHYLVWGRFMKIPPEEKPPEEQGE